MKVEEFLEEYKNGKRDFKNIDLSRADLSYANLSGADLLRADLSYANLSGADLSRADLSYANLSYANLSGADLSGVEVPYAQVSFKSHGECGRMLTAIRTNPKEPILYQCGCFSGFGPKLLDYIANGEPSLKASRILAFNTVTNLINYEQTN